MNQQDKFRELARLRVPLSLDPMASENEVLNRVRAKGSNQRCIVYQYRWGVMVETRTLLSGYEMSEWFKNRWKPGPAESIITRGQRLDIGPTANVPGVPPRRMDWRENEVRHPHLAHGMAYTQKGILVTRVRYNHNVLDALVNILGMFYKFDMVARGRPDGHDGMESGEPVVMRTGDDEAGPGFGVVVGYGLGQHRPMQGEPEYNASEPDDENDDVL